MNMFLLTHKKPYIYFINPNFIYDENITNCLLDCNRSFLFVNALFGQ